MRNLLLASVTLMGLASQVQAAVIQSSTLPSAPYTSPVPTTFTGTVFTNLTTSLGGVYRSPFEGTSAPNSLFTSVEGDATATFNLSGNVLSLIWGSPDTYNQLKFFSGVNGGGTLLDTILGSTINPANGTGFSYVTVSGIGNFNSVVLDNVPNSNAFEVSTFAVSSVPLPASLPLFGGALLALAGFGYGMNRWVSPKSKTAESA